MLTRPVKADQNTGSEKISLRITISPGLDPGFPLLGLLEVLRLYFSGDRRVGLALSLLKIDNRPPSLSTA